MRNPIAARPFESTRRGRFAERFAMIEAKGETDRVRYRVDSSNGKHQEKAADPAPRRAVESTLDVPATPSAAAREESTVSGPKIDDLEIADPIGQVRGVLKESIVAVIVFSVMINLLMLTGPLFMLQVYDRALPSGSVPTLAILFLLVTVLYGFFALIDGVRARVFIRLGTRIDELLHKPVYRAMIASTSKDPVGAGPQPMRDLDTVRSYMSSTAPAVFFDVPWVPIYLALIFFLHPLLGIFATIAAAVLICIAMLNKNLTQQGQSEVAQATFEAQRFAEEGRRDASVVRALGMEPALVGEWGNRKTKAIALMSQVSDKAGVFGTASKSLRLYFQSAMLALGALLAIGQEISAGMIIAGTIIMSRGLAPIEQMIGQWNASAGAQRAWNRLIELFAKTPLETSRQTQLPAPTGAIDLVNVACFAPNSPKPVLSGIEFSLQAGDGVGIVGPSGAGKSTLVKAILGIWPQMSGAVRFDGAAHNQWNSAVLGRSIGYLPQEATLLPGTVAQNISRFDPNASSHAVLEAAKVTGAHELAVSLANGYDTMVGPDGLQLSSGQAQRIALARAVYNFPPVVALDEPYSNLDADGEHALNQTIRALRARGSTVIVVTHRSSALNALDKVICIRNGKQALFGPKDEVLRAMTQAVQQLAESQPDAPVQEQGQPARPHVVVSRPSVTPPTRKADAQPQTETGQSCNSKSSSNGPGGQSTAKSGTVKHAKAVGADIVSSTTRTNSASQSISNPAAVPPRAVQDNASRTIQPDERALDVPIAPARVSEGKYVRPDQSKTGLRRTAETRNTAADNTGAVGGSAEGLVRTKTSLPADRTGKFIGRDAAMPAETSVHTIKIDPKRVAHARANPHLASEARSEGRPERAGVERPSRSGSTEPINHRIEVAESTHSPSVGSSIQTTQIRSDALQNAETKADASKSIERKEVPLIKSADFDPTTRPLQSAANRSQRPEASGSLDMKTAVESRTIPEPDLQVDRKADNADSSNARLKNELAEKLDAIQRQFERISGVRSGNTAGTGPDKSEDRIASLLRLRDELAQIKARRGALKSNG